MSEPARPVICSLESRRAEEMCALIERHGGQPMSAPSMREIPIEHNPTAIQIIQDIIAGRCDAIVLLTGVGTEALFEVARSQNLYEPLHQAFSRLMVIIRGPKAAVVLHKAGLQYQLRAAEPNTWREILAAIDKASIDLHGKSVVVQEYGLPNLRFYEELRLRGANVVPCPVYRWALPENLEPLENALRAIAEGQVDALLFTSANQVSSVLSVADRIGVLEAFRTGTKSRTLIISIGPTCSEALVENGFQVHAEASPPKMGQLVRTALETIQRRGT